MGRTIIISNRLPVIAYREKDGIWNFKSSSGGLVTALQGLKNVNVEFYWLGWLGIDIPPEDQSYVSGQLLENYQAIPVFLENNLSEPFYNGFCNSIIWPLFHYFSGEFQFSESFWIAYCQVNRLFEKALESLDITSSDILWIHDYHLMLLPLLIREHYSRDCPKIGFFLHIPFPSSEGIIASDLIGFHTHDYARHFTRSSEAFLPLIASSQGIEFNGRFSRIGIYPVGIDPSIFDKTSEDPEKLGHVSGFYEKDKKIILGVDRLDYIKGLIQKVEAFKSALENFKHLRGEVVLVQIAVPTRTDVEEYADLRLKLFEIVSSVNAKFGHSNYTPIQLLNQSIGLEELTKLYQIADICMVSSIRDGMNLVSLEYIACQRERKGILLLSKFAGAAQSLSGAVLFNPWNIEEAANALNEAILLPEETKNIDYDQLWTYVQTNTSMNWGSSFLADLKNSSIPRIQEIEKSTDLCIGAEDSYLQDTKILLCDLKTMEKVFPDPESKASLIIELRRRKNLALILYSDLDLKSIDEHCWGYEVGILTEQGCTYRAPWSNKWIYFAQMEDLSWQNQAQEVFKLFIGRVPGSILLTNTDSWKWKLLYGEKQLFSLQALEVKDILAIKLSRKRIQIIQRPRSLSILPISLNYREVFGQISDLANIFGDCRKICITQNAEEYHSELDDFIEALPIKHEFERISVRKVSQFKEKISKLLN